MIALLQRVSEASVLVNKNSPGSTENMEITGAIGVGILALVAIEKGDNEAQANRLLQRILAYRIFEDDGWVLLAPDLVTASFNIYVESSNEDGANKLLNHYAEVINEYQI